MKLSNSTNSALSAYVKLDASHISRLRRGKRNAVKDENCLRLMAEYFARRCTRDYNRRALADVLGSNFSALAEIDLPKALSEWLAEKGDNGNASVSAFLTGLSNLPVKQSPPAITGDYSCKNSESDFDIYYGVPGMRKAAVAFLAEVLSQDSPRTLLLFSDEPTDWMTEDRQYAAEWAAMMAQVLAKGNRIKVIHTVSRDLDEMLHAIGQWMPLYMTGSIEPYYYPKKRDGIFKKTLFIAPGVCAMVRVRREIWETARPAWFSGARLLLRLSGRNSSSIWAYADRLCVYSRLRTGRLI